MTYIGRAGRMKTTCNASAPKRLPHTVYIIKFEAQTPTVSSVGNSQNQNIERHGYTDWQEHPFIEAGRRAFL